MVAVAAADELLARYREIDTLMGGGWASPGFRRWQASTLDALRKALGFHPTVVEFQGLRFRAGPVNLVSRAELGNIPAADHDSRMRQDLGEAKRLLKRALEALHVDADAAVAAGPPVDPLTDAIRGAGLESEAQGRALDAAGRLRQALREPQPQWAAVGPALQAVLDAGLPAARIALGDLGKRLGDLR